MTGLKRSLEESSHDGDGASPQEVAAVKPPSPAASSVSNTSASSFRNVSACNRCRLRKNRCDQRLPACASCEKANVKCVGYDPITKREIPRRCVRLGFHRREAISTSQLTPGNFRVSQILLTKPLQLCLLSRNPCLVPRIFASGQLHCLCPARELCAELPVH
jgi:hypothetical protein